MTQLKGLREPVFEENLFEKYTVYEGKRHISTRFFSEIENKIHCHDDDDDDDELYVKNKMIIEHVNDDCLAKIFMYVPVFERSKIALVCKQWKRVLDYASWFDVKKLELIHWEFDKNPNFLIKNYPIIDEQFIFLKSLLNKCGRYLTKLDLTAYSDCDIVPVINEYCPNLVKLRIRIRYLNDAILDNAFTRLSKLKVLNIIFQCFPSLGACLPVNLINSLLNVADTLIDLNLSNWSEFMACNANFPEEFTSVVSQLKVLGRIQIAGINHPESLINHLNLRVPEVLFRYNEHEYHANNIDERDMYKNVKTLRIEKLRITDGFLYNIANVMSKLHTLRIYCNLISDAGIVAISKMNNLRILDCCGYNNVTDSSIKLLKNLFTIILPFSKKITEESALKVLENSPQMQCFSIKYTGVIPATFIKKAEEISRNRKKYIKVVISSEDGKPQPPIVYEYLTVDNIERINN